MTGNQYDVIIIGAGPGGAFCAYELKERTPDIKVLIIEKGRSIRPNLRTGICGEHGGEPSSVKFCAKIGLNYASCSPFRVPIARLAAAQAAVEE